MPMFGLCRVLQTCSDAQRIPIGPPRPLLLLVGIPVRARAHTHTHSLSLSHTHTHIHTHTSTRANTHLSHAGDEASKGLLIPEPAVRQISLPVTGARLIIASDGLWDAVNAKTVIGQLRTCNAREAASKAAVYAMRNKKHDDDVTVVVADFVPREADTHVPGLLKKTNGPAAAAAAALAAMGMREERAAQSWRPLEAPSDSWRWVEAVAVGGVVITSPH